MKTKFPNVSYKIMGQAEEAADSVERLGIAFLISIILIVINNCLKFQIILPSKINLNGSSYWCS